MLKRMAALAVVPLLAASLMAQGINTPANKDDWEEINFDYNSSVLVDGFPSLLRLAELLQKNPGYKVRIEGHTDAIGGSSFNDKLGLARATAVRDFLTKYGARANQLEVSSRGKLDPKYAGGKATYSRTDEARWMNRRVALTVMDEQGRTVGAGGAGDAIRAIQPAAQAGASDCCSEVMKRLDKLDTIERMLMDLADQNRKLQDEIAGLRQNQQALENRVNQTSQAANQAATQAASIPKPPSTEEVAKAVTSAIEQKKLPKFQLLGMNVGSDNMGDVTFTGKGRYFAPFGDNYAFQSEGEYFYTKGQREGQFDFGLVDRIGRFQAGLFSSFKHVNLTGDQTGGTLGQAAFAADYLFKWGKVGVFGTKAFLDDAIVNRENAISPAGVFLPNLVIERYLRVVDQAGVSGTGPLFGKNYFEGNLGYLRSTTAGDRLGGTLRLIFPVSRKIAFTVEGGLNETLLGPGNDGRAVVGVQFGNQLRPQEYLPAQHAVPMQIPRVRYEILTRQARVGNDAPVADAGPNQNLPGAATVTLNGSASYDPDGDPITYQWIQEGGASVSLAAPTSAITTFAAAASEVYTFRLVVKDSRGAQGSARVTITTGNGDIRILSFAANPSSINPGQSSTLGWQVINADSVTITGLGSVQLTGTAAVSPAVTTTYTLTATRGAQSVTATATVTVGGGPGSGLPVISSFTANPASISTGQSSTLAWAVQNATSVSINSIGGVPLTGTHAVSPTTTTTYILTATNSAGSVSSQATVTVTTAVSISSFTATPSSITAGQSSVLACAATGATSIAINGVTFPSGSGNLTVTPAQTTTYACVATGANNQTDQKQVTVTVSGSGGGGGPVLVIPGGNLITTDWRWVHIDASGSYSPGVSGPLSFHWVSVGNVAGIQNANTATPLVEVGPYLGDYYLDVTITDSQGHSTTTRVTIRYGAP